MKVLFILIQISLTIGLENGLDEIWLETKNMGSVNAIVTPKIYDYYTSLAHYGVFPAKKQEIEFRVKTCSDAFILLSTAQNLNSPSFYELALGHVGSGSPKMQTFLLRLWNTEAVYNRITPGIVSCYDFLRFRYKWTVEGYMVLYKITDTATEKIADYTDTSPIPISGVGIMSAFWANAVWAIKHTGRYMGYLCGVDNTYGKMTLLKTDSQTSIMRCAILCHSEHQCLGFNFNIRTKECQLIAAGQVVAKELAVGWKFFTKCLHNKSICLACIMEQKTGSDFPLGVFA